MCIFVSAALVGEGLTKLLSGCSQACVPVVYGLTRNALRRVLGKRRDTRISCVAVLNWQGTEVGGWDDIMIFIQDHNPKTYRNRIDTQYEDK